MISKQSPTLGFLAAAGIMFSANNVHAAVVLNQIGDLSSYNLTSSPGPSPGKIFTDSPDLNSMVLEDFTVTASNLRISNVAAFFQAQAGYADFSRVLGYSLSVFSSISLAATSLDGDIASLFIPKDFGATASQVIDPAGLAEYGLVSLSVDILLPAAGTYWLGVSPKSASTETGNFYLLNNGATGPVTPGNSNAKFANPANGWLQGALSNLDVNAAYSVTAVPEPAAASLSLIAGLALISMRKRDSRTPGS